MEGHAVLPALACQEIYAKPGVQFGRAAIDSEADATVLAAYQDMVSRGRTNIPMSAVTAMLTPNTELVRVTTTNAEGTQVVTLTESIRLKDEGLLSSSEKVWNGQGLAVFSVEKMRSWLWISPTLESPQELSGMLGSGRRIANGSATAARVESGQHSH